MALIIGCATLLPMTSKQKRVIAILALANTIVILTLGVFMTRSSDAIPLPFSGSRVPVPSPGACQWEATRLLAQAGLGGTVMLTPGGQLRIEIVYSLAPNQRADEAAQLVWIAFDIALALQKDECGSFTQVEVVILAQGSQTDTLIKASVSTADLVAFGAGELSEGEFIERVAYTIDYR
ncbi:MAG: hypothetical protein DRI79_01255 [Chloroflexi bacterium]|nr:MAG: hypothetical protein DRI79_01255 [Chloroflexota bacterium]